MLLPHQTPSPSLIVGSVSAMPVFMITSERGEGVPLGLEQMEFSGPPRVGEASAHTMEPMQQQLSVPLVQDWAWGHQIGAWTTRSGPGQG